MHTILRHPHAYPCTSWENVHTSVTWWSRKFSHQIHTTLMHILAHNGRMSCPWTHGTWNDIPRVIPHQIPHPYLGVRAGPDSYSLAHMGPGHRGCVHQSGGAATKGLAAREIHAHGCSHHGGPCNKSCGGCHCWGMSTNSENGTK